MVDFSKAPEGATHYSSISDKCVSWWMCDSSGWYCYDNYTKEWIGIKAAMGGYVTEIPQQLTVTCDDERVIREFIESCFKHEGDIDQTGYMWSLSDAENHVAKYLEPKKELVVPWEFIPDVINEITVSATGNITYSVGYSLMLKLDLDEIDLPVTVTRP